MNTKIKEINKETVITRGINREKLLNDTVKLSKTEDNELKTIYKVIETAKEIRVSEDNKALVLMGDHVYTINYTPFIEAVKLNMTEDTDVILDIAELKEDDARIFSTK